MFLHRRKRHHITHHDARHSLISMRNGQVAVIISIHGGNMATKRLADMGLTPGTGVKLIQKTLFSGPVQIEVCGSRLVLGRGLASKIIVEMQ